MSYGLLCRKRLAMTGNENNKMSSGVCTAYVRSKYGASTEQVRSKSQLGSVSKMRKMRIKRKNNFCFGYEKTVYRRSEKVSTPMFAAYGGSRSFRRALGYLNCRRHYVK